MRPGSEEYLNSEKYELKQRTLDGPLLPLVAKLNAARRENPALQWLDAAHDPRDRERAPVRIPQAARREQRRHGRQPRPAATQAGVCVVPVSTGFPPAYPVRDLLSDETWTWRIGRNYVKLGPGQSHVLRIGG